MRVITLRKLARTICGRPNKALQCYHIIEFFYFNFKECSRQAFLDCLVFCQYLRFSSITMEIVLKTTNMYALLWAKDLQSLVHWPDFQALADTISYLVSQHVKLKSFPCRQLPAVRSDYIVCINPTGVLRFPKTSNNFSYHHSIDPSSSQISAVCVLYAQQCRSVIKVGDTERQINMRSLRYLLPSSTLSRLRQGRISSSCFRSLFRRRSLL